MKLSEKEYLEHFGVRGMKWGVRKRSSDRTDKGQASSAKGQDGTNAPLKKPTGVVKRNSEGKTGRQLNKQARKDDVKAYRDNIDASRNAIKSGKLKEVKKDIKKNYKENKVELGSLRAKQIRNGDRALVKMTQMDALQPKNVKEATAIAISRQLTGPVGEMLYLRALAA